MNYAFETNIEKRMPDTGKVYYVERMTSDYAQAHPLNVDEFIEQVYQKYEQMAQEDSYARAMGWNKSREELRQMWNKTMQMPIRGDASIYPNRNGRTEPALMEVWSKAGDYWNRGFRLGEVLPAIVPGHKITRLGDGEWICLFPKDADLLNGHTDSTDSTEIHEIVPTTDSTDNIEPANNQCSTTPSEPVELDLFAQMQMQINQLRQENDRLCNMIQTEQAAACSHRESFDTENCSCVMQGQDSPTPRPRRQRKPRKPRYEVPAKSVAVAISQQEPMINTEDILKWLGLTIGAVILLIVIFKTGLLIPLGLIGLGLGGMLK